MDNFQIETAQNISIDQNVAGIGDRILAFIIDTVIVIAYMVLSGLTMAGLDVDRGSTWMYYLVLGLPPFLYHLLWEIFWNGQSPGKASMQIRVVKKDGTRPEFSNYLIRWLLRIIDISLTSGGVAVVAILLNGKGQRLGDIAGSTTVITERSKIGIHNTLGVDLPDNYQPKYAQVTVLNDKDVQEIKNIYEQARREGEHHIILSLSQKVAQLMDVQFEEKPVNFLQQVINDYNFYTRQ